MLVEQATGNVLWLGLQSKLLTENFVLVSCTTFLFLFSMLLFVSKFSINRWMIYSQEAVLYRLDMKSIFTWFYKDIVCLGILYDLLSLVLMLVDVIVVITNICIFLWQGLLQSCFFWLLLFFVHMNSVQYMLQLDHEHLIAILLLVSFLESLQLL